MVSNMSRKTIYLNGTRVQEDAARVSIFDRGFQFGDSVYEVVRCYNGVPFLLDEHLERLARSLRELGIKPIQSLADVRELCIRASHEHGTDPSILYLQITRGAADRTYSPPPGLTPTFVLYCQDEPVRDGQMYRKGIHVAVLEDIRWHRCDIKSTSLVASVLQKMRAASLDADDVLMERRGLGVVESGSGNLFVVKDGCIVTAPEGDYILTGTARGLVLKLAPQLSIAARLEFLSKADVYGADEVFITSTTAEVLPVCRVDSCVIGNGVPGPITQRILKAYRAEVERVTNYRYEE
jgi:D-alanine transaminase